MSTTPDQVQARLYIRYAIWREAESAIRKAAANLSVDDPLLTGYFNGLGAFTAGMSALAAGDVDAARTQATALDALWTSLSTARTQNAGDWYFRHAIRVLDVHRIELKGVIESADGAHRAAVATLTEAVRRERELGYWEPPHYTRPVLESLGEAYARAGKWEAAEGAFDEASRLRPRSGHALVALARAAQIANRPHEAAAARRRLLAVWVDADRDLPAMIEARRNARAPTVKNDMKKRR